MTTQSHQPGAMIVCDTAHGQQQWLIAETPNTAHSTLRHRATKKGITRQAPAATHAFALLGVFVPSCENVCARHHRPSGGSQAARGEPWRLCVTPLQLTQEGSCRSSRFFAIFASAFEAIRPKHSILQP
jgi:hypothetical protein